MALATEPPAPRLLIVDDDPDILDAVSHVFIEGGFDVATAADPREAVVLLERTDVSLVIADYSWSGPGVGTEWQVLARVAAAAAPAPIGLFTGWRVDEAEAAAHGIAFVLRKPADIETLLAAASEHIDLGEVAPGEAEVVRRYFDALTRRDWDGLVALCTEDVVYHVPGADPKLSRTIVGRDAFRSFSAETFAEFPEAVFATGAILPLPDGVIARFRSEWSPSPGKRAQLSGAVLFRFEHGLIASIGVRLDLRRIWAGAVDRPQPASHG